MKVIMDEAWWARQRRLRSTCALIKIATVIDFLAACLLLQTSGNVIAGICIIAGLALYLVQIEIGRRLDANEDRVATPFR
jgi:hypothetical protein